MSRTTRCTTVSFLFLTLLVGMTLWSGCDAQLAITPRNGNRNANANASSGDDQPGAGGTGSAPAPREQTVRVLLTNLTEDLAVDSELYVAKGPLADPAVELFVPENRRRDGIGIGGTGVVGPGETYEIDLVCQADLVIGTSGGVFTEMFSSDPIDVGEQPKWVAEGTVFDCGSVITFGYAAEGNRYRVVLAVQP